MTLPGDDAAGRDSARLGGCASTRGRCAGGAIRAVRALPKLLLGLMAVASCRTVPQEPPNAPPSDVANVATVDAADTESHRTWALKYVALPNAPFSIEGNGDKPWLLWATIDRDPNVVDDLYRLGDIDLHEPVDVPVARLAAAAPSVEVPPASVWLLGPDGACKARVEQGTARLDLHEGGPDYQVSVSFALSGCAGTAWAPVAIAGDVPAPGLRWFPVRRLESTRLRTKYRDLLVRERGTTPRVELLIAGTAVVEVRYGAVDPDGRCTAWLWTELGVLRDDDLEPWTCSSSRGAADCSNYELLGTLGTATEARLAVLIDIHYAPMIFSLADETFAPILPYIEADAEAGERSVSFTDLDPCESEDGP